MPSGISSGTTRLPASRTSSLWCRLQRSGLSGRSLRPTWQPSVTRWAAAWEQVTGHLRTPITVLPLDSAPVQPLLPSWKRAQTKECCCLSIPPFKCVCVCWAQTLLQYLSSENNQWSSLFRKLKLNKLCLESLFSFIRNKKLKKKQNYILPLLRERSEYLSLLEVHSSTKHHDLWQSSNGWLLA